MSKQVGYERRKCSKCGEGLGFTESDPCEKCDDEKQVVPTVCVICVKCGHNGRNLEGGYCEEFANASGRCGCYCVFPVVPAAEELKALRPIKFRAQCSMRSGDKASGVRGNLVYGHYYVTHERPNRSECWIIDDDGSTILVYPDSVGQFTGLLDMKGQEIYEGDIVQRHPISKYVQMWAVGFSPDEGWGLNEADAKIDYEVVGNIHENPEFRELALVHL